MNTLNQPEIIQEAQEVVDFYNKERLVKKISFTASLVFFGVVYFHTIGITLLLLASVLLLEILTESNNEEIY